MALSTKYLSYTFASAERTIPSRKLLKPNTPFNWTAPLNKLFEDSKSIIIDDIHKGIEIFAKSKPTCLATDWSKDGVGLLCKKLCLFSVLVHLQPGTQNDRGVLQMRPNQTCVQQLKRVLAQSSTSVTQQPKPY